jgi:hypothetical protein
MTCDQARPLLSPLLDEALPPAEAAAARAHVLSCPACGAESDSLKRASRLVRELPLRPLPPGFFSRLEERRRKRAFTLGLPATQRPLAFAAAAVVCGLVVAGPWRGRRLLRAPGEPLPGATSLPSLKLGVEPPPPAAASAPAADSLSAAGSGAAAPAMDMPAASQTARKSEAAGGQPFGTKPAYTNEQLQQALQEESTRLGLAAASKEAPQAPEPFLGRKLGGAGVRQRGEAVSRQLAALRQAIDDAAGKRTVIVGGSVAPMLRGGSTPSTGRALADSGALQDGFWSGDYGAGNEGTRTVTDEAAWKALWRSLSAGPAPAVDFAKERLVAIFLGPRPTGGYSVEIVDIVTSPSRMIVRYREQVPPSGQTPREGATAPYAIKAVPRTELPVRFEKVR